MDQLEQVKHLLFEHVSLKPTQFSLISVQSILMEFIKVKKKRISSLHQSWLQLKSINHQSSISMSVKKSGRPKRRVKKEKRRKERNLIHQIQKELRKLWENGEPSTLMIRPELLSSVVRVIHKRAQRKSSKNSLISRFTSHSLIIQPEDSCGETSWPSLAQDWNRISLSAPWHIFQKVTLLAAS